MKMQNMLGVLEGRKEK